MAMVLTVVTGNQEAVSETAAGSALCDLERLIVSVQEHDETALAQLYELTIQKVFAVAMALLDNRADAQEVSEDVFVQAWHRCRQFDPERGSVQAWLTTMCRSRSIDLLRARRRQRNLAEAVAAEPPGIAWDTEPTLIQDSRLGQALDTLSQTQRQVLALAYFRGLTHSEIAGRLSMPPGTVKTHLRRALQALRAQLTQ